MTRPTPSSTARSSSPSVLLLPWKPTRSIGKPARSATAQLAAGADVEGEPVLGQPARDGRAEERLAGVEDVVAGEGVAEGAGPGAEVVLVEDVRRRAVLADQLGQRHSPDARARRRPWRPSATRGARRARWGRPAHGASAGRPACSSAGRRRRAPSRRGGRWARPLTSAREPRRRGGAGRWRARSGSRRPASSRARWQVAGLLVAARQHPAGVVEAVVGAGELLEVARDPVRLAQLGGGLDHPRELGERAQQLALLLVGEQRRGATRPRRPGRPRCASGWRRARGRTAR